MSNLERKLRKISAKYQNGIQRQQELTSTLAALHPARIGAHLPSNEQEYKTAEHHNSLADNAKRRGAGHVGSSGLILRPSGMGAYKEFHDLYTREEEKVVDKAPRGLNDFIGKPYDGPKFKTISFPETFCILCMKKDIPPPKGCSEKAARRCWCCKMIDITTLSHPIAELNLKPMDIIRSAICASCKNDIFREAHQSNQSGIKVVHEGNLMPIHVIKAMHRYKLLKSNWEYVLIASRLVETTTSTLGQGYRTEGIGTA